MESLTLLGFVGILRETLKIFCRNGQLMTSLTLSYISLFSIFYLSLVFYTKPLISDFINKGSLVPFADPKSPDFAYLLVDVKNDIRAFVGIEWIFIIICTIASLFFATAVIIVSALSHGGKSLVCKELLLSTVKSLKRPFFTWFYTTLLGLGYNFFVLTNLLSIVLIIQSPVACKALSIVIAIFATILYTYLAVIWTLALVISVLEEKSGIEALGKAAQIVKSMQLHGFVLNLLLMILSFVLLQALMLISKQSSTLAIIIGLLVLISLCLVKMFWWVAYTVFYYQCKKTHGEEVELQGSIEYSKIPTSPFLIESIHPDEGKFCFDVI